jgi:transcriptional regulator with XRE-family HTH domain
MDTSPQTQSQRIPHPRSESDPNPSAAATVEFEAEVASVSDRIRALRASGLTAKQIREALPGVSAWAVNCAINRDTRAHAAHPGLRARAKDADRERARALRLEGKTYKEIRAVVNVSSATLSMWLRDLPYPRPDRAAHAAHMNRVQTARNDERRRAEKEAGFAAVGVVSDRELMLIGVALYWAEGTKDKPYARREHVTFINSDEGMIRLFLRWLDLLEIEEVRRQYRVSIHESADATAAEAYWRGVVDVPGADFRRPTLKKHNPKTVRKRVGDDYNGCLTVKVLQASALYQRIDGLWRGILAARGAAVVRD